MGDDLLEHVAHLEVVRVALVVVDVATCQGRPVQVPDQDLLIERQRREPVRVQLRHRGVVHSFEQILAIGGACGDSAVAIAAGLAESVSGVFSSSP